MGHKDIINSLKAIEYSKYKDITSYEKLMIYAVLVLYRKKIPLTFNYICIASFKIFPDAFCCDEEFREFPSVDRLNRTMMHLKYVKSGKPFLAGSIKEGYTLTPLGKALAEDTESIINSTEKSNNVKVRIVDGHKKGFGKDYLSFVEGEKYKKYIENGEIDYSYIWEFFQITPFTQINTTRKKLEDIKEYAKEMNDNNCIKYVNEILNRIR